MSSKIYTLLENISAEATDSTYSFGDKNVGAGYYRIADGLHTAVYDVTQFAGTIKIQGTLALYPDDSDWFDIDGTEIGGDSSLFTSLDSINFVGNFVWVRAAYNLQNGTINSITYTI